MPPQQHDPNSERKIIHVPLEWKATHPPALIIATDVLSALLPAAASFYKVAMQARQEHRPWALDEHELIALHIAIDTAARELGVQDQPLYKDIVRR